MPNLSSNITLHNIKEESDPSHVIVVNKTKLTEEVVVERRSARNRRQVIQSNSDEEMKPAYKSDIDSSDSDHGVKTRRPPGRPRKSSSSDNEVVRNKSNVRGPARHNDTIMEQDSESSEEEAPRRGKRGATKSTKKARTKSISVPKGIRHQEAPIEAPRAKP